MESYSHGGSFNQLFLQYEDALDAADSTRLTSSNLFDSMVENQRYCVLNSGYTFFQPSQGRYLEFHGEKFYHETP